MNTCGKLAASCWNPCQILNNIKTIIKYMKYFLISVILLFSLSCCSSYEGGNLENREMKWLPSNPPTARLKCDIEKVLNGKKVTFEAGEEVRVLCQWYVRGKFRYDMIVEDIHGNRMDVPFDMLETDSNLEGLKLLNPHWHYYVTEDLEPWKGKTIDKVVESWGDYTFCVKDSVYRWTNVSYVFGIGRCHGVTLKVGHDGKVASAYNDFTSNLFGYLPFYATILGWNIYQPQKQLLVDIDDFRHGEIKEGTFWYDGVWQYLLYSLPLVLVIAVCIALLSLLRMFSNDLLITIASIGSIAITYIMGITFLEFCHSYWIILLPIYVFSGLLWIAIAMSITFVRCPKCKTLHLRHKRTVIGVKKYRICPIYSYPRNGGSRPDVEIEYEKVEEILHTERCSSCGYSKSHKSENTVPLTMCPKCGNPISKCMHPSISFDIAERSESSTYSYMVFDMTLSSRCTCGKFSFGPYIFHDLKVDRSRQVRTSGGHRYVPVTPNKDVIEKTRQEKGYYQKYNCIHWESFDNTCDAYTSKIERGHCDCNNCRWCSQFSPRHRDEFD